MKIGIVKITRGILVEALRMFFSSMICINVAYSRRHEKTNIKRWLNMLTKIFALSENLLKKKLTSRCLSSCDARALPMNVNQQKESLENSSVQIRGLFKKYRKNTCSSTLMTIPKSDRASIKV